MASGAGTCPPGVTWSTACGSASAKTAHNLSGVVPAWVDHALICSGENTLPIWSAETGWFSPVETHDCALLPRPAASKRETTEATPPPLAASNCCKMPAIAAGWPDY